MEIHVFAHQMVTRGSLSSNPDSKLSNFCPWGTFPTLQEHSTGQHHFLIGILNDAFFLTFCIPQEDYSLSPWLAHSTKEAICSLLLCFGVLSHKHFSLTNKLFFLVRTFPPDK